MKTKSLTLISISFLILLVSLCFLNLNEVKAWWWDWDWWSNSVVSSEDEYGCPDGNGRGSDIYIRTHYFYEDGSDDYSDWVFHKECSNCYRCPIPSDEATTTPLNCSTSSSPVMPSNKSSKSIPVTMEWCAHDVEKEGGNYMVEIYEYDNSTSSEKYDDSSYNTYIGSFSTSTTSVCSNKLSNTGNLVDYTKWYQVFTDSYFDLKEWTSYMWKVGDSTWFFDTTNMHGSLSVPKNVQPYDNPFNPVSPKSIPVTITWDEVDTANSYYIAVHEYNQEEGLIDMDEARTIEITEDNSLELGVKDITVNKGYYIYIIPCLEDDGTACGQHCCANEDGSICNDSSAKTFFATTNNPSYFPSLYQPTTTSPTSSKSNIVYPTDIFEFIGWGARGFRFELYEEDGTNPIMSKSVFGDGYATTSLLNDWQKVDNPTDRNPIIENNTVYKWSVTPCFCDNCDTATTTDDTLKNCQSDKKSNFSYFKTAGDSSNNIYPIGSDTIVPLPVEFEWEAENSLSYIFQLDDSEVFGSLLEYETLSNPNFSVDYPTLRPGHTYNWRIKSCVIDLDLYDEDFNIYPYCDKNWVDSAFTVSDFIAPTSTQLSDGEVFTNEFYLHWEPAISAKSYEYQLTYNERSEQERSNECEASATPILTGTTDSTHVIIPNFPGTNQKCLGEYTLGVTACINQDCEDQSSENAKTSIWTFNFKQAALNEMGILPCNRRDDNLETPWNERETCQLKHVPVFFYQTIDFLLWRGSVVVFLGLTIFSALSAFSTAGLPIQMVNLKTLWSSAGKGFFIMFFSWTFLNLILNLVGITENFLRPF